MAGAVFGEVGGLDSGFFPPIENDTLYVTQINHEILFAWQVQYSLQMVLTLLIRVM